MGVFERTKTNWKYIFILIIVTIIAGSVILSFAYKVGQDINALNRHIYSLYHEN